MAFKYKNTISRRTFSKLKDKTPTSEKSNVVYCVNCNNCRLKYIGQTGNRIRTKMYGHKSDIKDKNRVGCKLAERVKNTGQTFIFYIKKRTNLKEKCLNQ